MAMVMIGIYPPWKEFGAVEKPSVFAPINQPPALSAGATRLDIDFSRLGIELLLAAAVTAGLIVTAGGRPDPPSFIPAASSNNRHSSKAVRPLESIYRATIIWVSSSLSLKMILNIGKTIVRLKARLNYLKVRRVQLELAKDIRVDLSFLSAFPSDAIYSVDASDAKVSDDDLSKLGGLGSIRELDLSGTTIGSTGVVNLKSLAKLEKLWLDRTSIDEQCVPALISLSKLKKLSITGTNLNELALRDFEKRYA
jgi:hypothetical protein